MTGNLYFLFLSALLSAFVLAGPARADQACGPLTVAAAEIPYFVESEHEGEFVELLRAAAKRSGLKLEIKLFPKKRALSLFRNGQVDALLPHSSAGAEVPSYKSLPIFKKKDFVFVRKGMPIPMSFKELEGLSIGLTSQYAYSKSLTDTANVEFSRAPNSDLDNIKMLSIGRFDGAIIEERSGLKAISEAGVTNITYDPDHPIDELLVWVLFSKTSCGQVFMEKINSSFNAMIGDGEWHTIKKLSAPNG